MRTRRWYIFLCPCCLCLCVTITMFVLRRNPRNYSHEIDQETQVSHPTFPPRKRTVVPRITGDLRWIKNLGKMALDTVPGLTSPNCSQPVFLSILVASSSENYDQRNSIRGSWAKIFYSGKKGGQFNGVLGSYGPGNLVRTVFLLGKSGSRENQAMVDSESEMFGDIIFGEFEDNYQNLMLKTRLGLTWVYSQCSSAYVLKTDDDVFVNVRQLLHWLVRSAENNFYTGWCNYRSKVSRNKLSKWYVSVDDYSEDEFPPYCLGGGYLISSDVLSKIIRTLYTEHAIPLEDIFVGIAINKLNIQPLDNRKFFNLLFSGVNNLCDYLNIFLLHPVQTRELLNMRLRADLAWRVCS